jgi:hypothetical protein
MTFVRPAHKKIIKQNQNYSFEDVVAHWECYNECLLVPTKESKVNYAYRRLVALH